MHGICDMHMPKGTSLGQPQSAVERVVMASAAAAAHPGTPTVKRQPLAAVDARVGPPERVEVGS